MRLHKNCHRHFFSVPLTSSNSLHKLLRDDFTIASNVVHRVHFIRKIYNWLWSSSRAYIKEAQRDLDWLLLCVFYWQFPDHKSEALARNFFKGEKMRELCESCVKWNFMLISALIFIKNQQKFSDSCRWAQTWNC